jgi:hypothetical protein
MPIGEHDEATGQVPAGVGPRGRGRARFWFWIAVILSLASAYVAVELGVRNTSAGYYLPVRAEPGEHVPKWRFRMETEGAWRWMYRWYYDEPADVSDTRWLRYRELYRTVGGEEEVLTSAELAILAELAATEGRSPTPSGDDRSPGAFEPPELRKRAAITGFDFWPLTADELQRCRAIIDGYAPPLRPEDVRLLGRLLEWAPLTAAERRRMEEHLSLNRANNRLHRWATVPCCLLYLVAPMAFVISGCLALQRNGIRRMSLLVLCMVVSSGSLVFVLRTTRGAHIF